MPSPTSNKKLTIGMATYDDFDGVYFTVQSIRVHHPEILPEIEFLVIDNNPGGPHAEALRKLGDRLTDCRYLPALDFRGTAVRDLVFREATTPWVLCVDSHILIEPGALRRLVGFLDQRPDCRDLLQGPLVDDALQRVSTHFEPTWSAGMYGAWRTDERGVDPDGEPFEVPMQGLGLFACHREAWPGFNPRFVGFGGEEGYIHEKFRQAGRRTLCLPFLRWVHRFTAFRSGKVAYDNTWRGRIRNYLIGFDELDLDPQPVCDHFREHIDEAAADQYIREARSELASPLFFFDAIYCINLEAESERREEMQQRFEALGIAHRVRWLPAVETSDSHQIGCALSHRAIIESAQRQGLGNVLVFEDDAIFLEDTLEHLGRSVGELRSLDWNLFYLGGHTWGRSFPEAPGCSALLEPDRMLTCTQAIAYNRPVFRKILDDVPADAEGVEVWLETHRGIDQYLRLVDKRFLAHPIVASQPSILAQEDPEYRGRFVLGDVPEAAPVEGVFDLSPGYEVLDLTDRMLVYRLEMTDTLALSTTAGIILDLIDGRRSVAEIRELLQEAYPESAEEVGRDVDRTFGQLIRSGAVTGR